jgi:hypothetical protein
MVEPPVSYLESTVPAAACEIAISIRTASYADFACRELSSSTVYPLHYLRPTATAMARKKATVDEVDAHATANGYWRGVCTGKKTVSETVISMGSRLGKIKMQRWISM